MSSLADLIKSRRSSGGSIAGSLSYGFKERMKEVFDPRRMLNQGGLMTALFPSLKSYKAGSGKNIKKLNPIIGDNSSTLSEPILESIRISTKTSAKNSLVLPSMARDIFVMNKNIKQMVKIFGGKPKDSADEWFSRQAAREAAYESRFGAKTKSKKDTKPTPEKEPDKKGFFRTIADMVMKIPFIASLAGVISKLSGAIAKIAGPVGSVIAVVALLGGAFFKLIRFLSKFKMFAALIGAIGIGVLADKWNSFQKMSGDLNNSMSDSQNNSSGTDNNQTTKKDSPKSETSTAGYVSEGMKAIGITQDTGNKLIGGAAVVSGVVTAKSAAKFRGVNKVAGSKILDARRMSSEFLKKSSTNKITGGIVKAGEKIGSTAGKVATGLSGSSIWKKFLEFVARKSPTLFAKIGVRLAQAGVLATIPVVGWIGAAISLGFNLWLAYDLYELWKEFNNVENNRSPTQEPADSANALPGPSGTQSTNSSSKSSTSIGGVKGAADKRQAVAVKEMQSDKEIFKTEDYLTWREGQWKEKDFSSLRKNLSSGIYDPSFGVDAYKKAKNLTGPQKPLGDKIKNGNAEVRAARTEAQRPQVTVNKNEKTIPKKPMQSGGSDFSQASVYDEEFLRLLGMSTTNLGKVA